KRQKSMTYHHIKLSVPFGGVRTAMLWYSLNSYCSTYLHLLRLVSTDADVCADRCGCPRRPMRMSAPTDADICVDRCGWH
ncbi:hypothetical protein, partial [Leyella stercorea]|uniref:hypothetical protein n=1 Tax=Leyella stercorea TaxID=363265 RepID=UPI00243209A1